MKIIIGIEAEIHIIKKIHLKSLKKKHYILFSHHNDIFMSSYNLCKRLFNYFMMYQSIEISEIK